MVAIAGAFSTRSTVDWPIGDHRLSIGVQLDPAFVLEYRSNPQDPKWADFYPPHDPELTFSLPYVAAAAVIEVETHIAEPPLGDVEYWDYLEQGGSEFGLLPTRIEPLISTSEAEHDRVFGPVLATISNGWNMVRVASRDQRPSADETLIRIDIWPIAEPVAHQVIRNASQAAPPSTRPLVPPPSTAAGSPPSSTAMVGSDERKNESVLIRVDFDDFEAWNEVARAAIAPDPVEGFTADLVAVNNPVYRDVTVARLLEMIGEPPPFYVFAADHQTLTHSEHPILAISIGGPQYPDEHGQTVRVLPAAMASIENNLSLGNMDFIEFVEAADADGIYRGF
ncbi:MAG: hypothetical protein C0482_16195 [Gordonia sp.]|nr:hypothetical protein [Gordonia sp. (in: high G+C Gram-positive bacteria)]